MWPWRSGVQVPSVTLRFEADQRPFPEGLSCCPGRAQAGAPDPVMRFVEGWGRRSQLRLYSQLQLESDPSDGVAVGRRLQALDTPQRRGRGAGVTFAGQASGWGIWGSSLTDRKLSRAHVGLALASALVVLLASGVAISRIGDRDDDRTSAIASGSTSSTVAAESGPVGSAAAGGGTGSGAASVPAGASAGADQAAAAAGGPGSAAHGQRPPVRNGQGAQGSSSATTSGPSPSTANSRDAGTSAGPSGSEGSSGSGEAQGSSGGGRGSSGDQGGQEPRPRPSGERPEEKPLLAATASVGQGAQGGVVGAAVTGTTPKADVTVGTNPLVGNHPPSQGTGISFSGTVLHPPPSLPTLSG